MDYASLIEDYDDLNTILKKEHKDKKIVCTIGSWAILHRGHVEYLKKAKELGDILVVGVDTDVAYKLYKDPTIRSFDTFSIAQIYRLSYTNN